MTSHLFPSPHKTSGPTKTQNLFIIAFLLISFTLSNTVTNTCGPNCIRCSGSESSGFQCDRCTTTIYKVTSTSGSRCDVDLEDVGANRKQTFTDYQKDSLIGIFGCRGIYQGMTAEKEGERCVPVKDPYTKHCQHYQDDKITCRRCNPSHVLQKKPDNTTSCTIPMPGDFKSEGCTELQINSQNRSQGFCYACEAGLILDWDQNTCSKEGSTGVEGCLIEKSGICSDCDVDAGYYSTVDPTTFKIICTKENKPNKQTCGENCIMCQDNRCGATLLAPFKNPFVQETMKSEVGMTQDCLIFKWKYDRSYCVRCRVNNFAPSTPGDGSTCSQVTDFISGCIIYGESKGHCLMCEGGQLFQPNVVLSLKGNCIDIPKGKEAVENCLFGFSIDGEDVSCKQCIPGYQLSSDKTSCVSNQNGKPAKCSVLGFDGKCLISEFYAGYTMRKNYSPSKHSMITGCGPGCISCTKEAKCLICLRSSIKDGACLNKELSDKNCLITREFGGQSKCMACSGSNEPNTMKENRCMNIKPENEIDGCLGYYLDQTDLDYKFPRCLKVASDSLIKEKENNKQRDLVRIRPGNQVIEQCETYSQKTEDSSVSCMGCYSGYTLSGTMNECLKTENGCKSLNTDGGCTVCDGGNGYYSVLFVDKSNYCLKKGELYAMAISALSLFLIVVLGQQ